MLRWKIGQFLYLPDVWCAGLAFFCVGAVRFLRLQSGFLGWQFQVGRDAALLLLPPGVLYVVLPSWRWPSYGWLRWVGCFCEPCFSSPSHKDKGGGVQGSLLRRWTWCLGVWLRVFPVFLAWSVLAGGRLVLLSPLPWLWLGFALWNVVCALFGLYGGLLGSPLGRVRSFRCFCMDPSAASLVVHAFLASFRLFMV